MTRVAVLVALLAAACATTPDPNSRDGRLAANLERLETQHAALLSEVKEQRARLASAHGQASRTLDPVLDRPGCSVEPATSAVPVRFEVATKKFRVVAEPSACRVVSP